MRLLFLWRVLHLSYLTCVGKLVGRSWSSAYCSTRFLNERSEEDTASMEPWRGGVTVRMMSWTVTKISPSCINSDTGRNDMTVKESTLSYVMGLTQDFCLRLSKWGFRIYDFPVYPIFSVSRSLGTLESRNVFAYRYLWKLFRDKEALPPNYTKSPGTFLFQTGDEKPVTQISFIHTDWKSAFLWWSTSSADKSIKLLVFITNCTRSSLLENCSTIARYAIKLSMTCLCII